MGDWHTLTRLGIYIGYRYRTRIFKGNIRREADLKWHTPIAWARYIGTSSCMIFTKGDSSPDESIRVLGTVRLRTDAAKRFKLVKNATAVIWKMLLVAERAFRRLKHPEVMPAVYLLVRMVSTRRAGINPELIRAPYACL